MDFQQVVRTRRMVRAFQPGRKVEPAARDRILANAQRGPSAGFSQGSAYVVLQTDAERHRFWQATSGARMENDWLVRMRQAPLLVLCWCNDELYLQRYAERDKRDADPFSAPYWYVDAGMGVLLMLQTAVDEGLGACLFGIPPSRVEAVRAEFGVPAGWLPVGVVAVGYPDAPHDRPSPSLRRGRRASSEVIHMGHWGSAADGPPASCEE